MAKTWFGEYLEDLDTKELKKLLLVFFEILAKDKNEGKEND